MEQVKGESRQEFEIDENLDLNQFLKRVEIDEHFYD